MNHSIVLTILALLPCLFLMRVIYKKDKIEPEPISLVVKTVILGAIAVIPTIFLELILDKIIYAVFSPGTLAPIVIENFIGIALVEEFFKMMACHFSSWRNKEFNYTFDGIIYAVASALGFAAVENVMYVLDGDLPVALMRALTSIPAHAIFGVHMGIHLGLAKYAKYNENTFGKAYHLFMALLIPTLIHGSYDLLATMGGDLSVLAFLVFVIIIDIMAVRRVNSFEEKDRQIL